MTCISLNIHVVLYSVIIRSITTSKEYVKTESCNVVIDQEKIRPAERWHDQALHSPNGSPVLLIKKSDGNLHFCKDSCALNEISISNRYLLLIVKILVTRLAEAKHFTRLDLHSGYW